MLENYIIYGGSMTPNSPPDSALRKKALFNFSLFFIFFIFYLISACIQTPTFKEIAYIPVLGLPLGVLLSLLVFPVSWVIMIIWFWRSK